MLLRSVYKNTPRLLANVRCSDRATMSSNASPIGDTDASVLINEVNRCGILTLNRPKALNALNLEASCVYRQYARMPSRIRFCAVDIVHAVVIK